MVDGWLRRGLIVLVVALGLVVGRIDGAVRVDRDLARPANGSTQKRNQEIFDAVRKWLTEAQVAKQDMPQRIISVEPAGSQRFKVHMKMVQGEGWFEVWKDGTQWRVKGLPAPRQRGGGGA